VILHEYGHWVHHKWLNNEAIPFGSHKLSSRDSENDNAECFAETFRVFANNPNDLKEQNPERWEWIAARLKAPDREYPPGKPCEFDSDAYEKEKKFANDNLSGKEIEECIELLDEEGLSEAEMRKILHALAKSRLAS
jgi:hypothetical protein